MTKFHYTLMGLGLAAFLTICALQANVSQAQGQALAAQTSSTVN